MHLLFDIGGTNLRAAYATPEGISAIHIEPRPEKPGEAAERLADLAEMFARGAGDPIRGATGGIAGVIRNGAITISPNLRSYEGFPFASELSKALGAPATAVNDAMAEALGEARRGAGQGARIVAYLAVGTGVGGARVVDGRIDVHAAGFEPGHHLIDSASMRDLEDYAGGRAVAKRAGANSSQEAPRAIYDELTPILARGIYNAVAFWSPDVVLLGGSVINDETGYRLADIKRELEKLPRLFPELPELRRSALGNAAGLWGARELAQESGAGKI